MKDVILSVIIPAYNVEDYLSGCLDSILQQSCKDIEIILINDGSTDFTGQICDDYANKYNCINVFHQKNHGQSFSRNLGLRHAKGKYISFIDSDDVLSDRETLNNNLNILEQNPNFDIVQFPHRNINNGKVDKIIVHDDILIESKKQLFDKLDWSNLLSKEGIITGLVWDKIYRRSSIAGIYFDEGMIYEDTEFLTRIFRNIQCLYISSLGMYDYIFRQNSTTTGKISKYRRTSFLKMLMSVHSSLIEYNPSSNNKIGRLFLFMLEYYIYSIFLYGKCDFANIRSYIKQNVPYYFGSFKDSLKLFILHFCGLEYYEQLALIMHKVRSH
jgi:glycosyltransferase involved in cell wall biosynthesis